MMTTYRLLCPIKTKSIAEPSVRALLGSIQICTNKNCSLEKPVRFFLASPTLPKVSSRARARCQAPSTPSCGRRHRLSTRDATRGAIDAARGRMIDRRGSVVTAEPDEEFLLWRRMSTSRKCVLWPCRFYDPRISRPPPVLTFDTANLEARATPSPGRR